MAQPPLEHQIRHASRILICRSEPDAGSFACEYALKGVGPGASLRPNIRTFELLGYKAAAGEKAVLVFGTPDDLIELLPVRSGTLVYAPTDASVRRELSLKAFEALVDEVLGPRTRAAALRFASPHPLSAFLPRLNALGLWAWTARDSDRHGDYVSALADPNYAMVKIFEDGEAFVLSVACRTGTKPAAELLPEILEACTRRVLPALAAGTIAPAEPVE